MTSDDKFLRWAVIGALSMAGFALVWRIVVDSGVLQPPPPPPPPPPTSQQPVPIENWEQYLTAGHRIGPADAKVVIIEFADFECPACRMFTLQGMKPLLERYPDDVALVFRHWPLKIHKFAYQSARVAECAAEQGQFEAIHDLLFEKQDSIGLKSWRSYAEDSGVPDLARFDACAARTGPVAAIDADSAIPPQLEATGTPVVILDGIRYPGAPMPSRLATLVDSALMRAKGRR